MIEMSLFGLTMMNLLPLKRFTIAVCFIFWLDSLWCAVYEIVGDEKSLLATCNGSKNDGDISMQQIIDLSGLSFILGDDYETIYVSGNMKVLMDIPQNPIKMEVDVYRLERGEWTPTIISLKRDNLCDSLKNPLEFWHFIFAGKIPKDQRVCPPKMGHIYTLTNITNRFFIRNLPRWNIDGDIKAIVHFTVDQHKTCVAVYARVYVS